MKNNFYKNYGKRIFDLLTSLTVIFFCWPIFLIICLIVKLSSPGPIIFRQKRVGKNGTIFTLFKFRTMVKNAEQLKEKYLHLNEADGPVFKIKNDPRFINGIGKFLARIGLDELPNIFNILKGDLSWVGPRPLPVKEAKKIKPQISKKRESVLPGITSWWIVNGAHSLNFKQWMKLDQKYIKNLNFLTDLQILLKTFYLIIQIGKNFILKKVF